jgi:hypothetical protein
MIIELPIAAAELGAGSFATSRTACGGGGAAGCLGGSACAFRLVGVDDGTSSRLFHMESPVECELKWKAGPAFLLPLTTLFIFMRVHRSGPAIPGKTYHSTRKICAMAENFLVPGEIRQ